MERRTILIQICVFFTCSLLLSVEGAIRCYCNKLECQETGHTCISHIEKCFSKLYTVYDTQKNKTNTPSDEHGCVDLSVAANPSHESICDGTGDVVKQLKRFEPLIMCCSDNMCNYRENQDIQVDIIDAPMISTDDNHNEEDSMKEDVRGDNSSFEDGNQDLMFRAAVIAVPIVGGLILIVLILLAVRMLREDYNRRYDSHSGIEKAQNFIQQRFNKKDLKKTIHPKTQVSSESKSSSEKLLTAPIHKESRHARTEHWLEGEDRLLKDSHNRHTENISRSQLYKPNNSHSTKLSHV